MIIRDRGDVEDLHRWIDVKPGGRRSKLCQSHFADESLDAGWDIHDIAQCCQDCVTQGRNGGRDEPGQIDAGQVIQPIIKYRYTRLVKCHGRGFDACDHGINIFGRRCDENGRRNEDIDCSRSIV